jgi:mannose-6-phosphate isomerase-like protein (cupin superfamily)
VHVSSKQDAPALSRGDGLVSAPLHTGGGDSDLTVTWVEIDPGASQVRHSHDPEQVYVVVAGEGEMTVGGETRAVVAGDLVRLSPDTDHGIENTGDRPLEYVSAAAPAFPREEVEVFYDAW